MKTLNELQKELNALNAMSEAIPFILTGIKDIHKNHPLVELPDNFDQGEDFNVFTDDLLKMEKSIEVRVQMVLNAIKLLETPLKPCPFCGSNEAKLTEHLYVGCEKCGCAGADCVTPEEAIAMWNTRYNDDDEFLHGSEMPKEGTIITMGDLRKAIADFSDDDQVVVEIHEGSRSEDLYTFYVDEMTGIQLVDDDGKPTKEISEIRFCI